MSATAEEVRLCECGCGRAIRKDSRLDRIYALEQCRTRVMDRRASRRERAHRRQVDVRGRQCRWCQAFDHETRWSQNNAECAACNRSRHRIPCPSCGGPAAARAARCASCEAPGWLTAVILLDEGSERERTIYRASRRGWVSIDSKDYAVTEGEPLVVTLPTEVWVRVRR
jgi:hypothetical protein